MIEISPEVAVTVIGLAFGGWAAVASWGVSVFRDGIESLRVELTELKKAGNDTAYALTEHVRLTEKRLTMLETEFGFIRRYLAGIISDSGQHNVFKE